MALQPLLFLALVARAAAHGAMTFPKPRNSLDGALEPWTKWAYPCDSTHQGDMCKITFCEDGKNCQGSCPISAHNGASQLNASNGQSCYWFSNGCTVGCDACDGTQNHVGHGNQKFLYKGMSAATLRSQNITLDHPWNPAPGDMQLDPASIKTLEIKANCENPAGKPTVCDPRLRTANAHAECGGPQDIYYYSPWRAPGAAPVIDACGSAGGRFPGQATTPPPPPYTVGTAPIPPAAAAEHRPSIDRARAARARSSRTRAWPGRVIWARGCRRWRRGRRGRRASWRRWGGP